MILGIFHGEEAEILAEAACDVRERSAGPNFDKGTDALIDHRTHAAHPLDRGTDLTTEFSPDLVCRHQHSAVDVRDDRCSRVAEVGGLKDALHLVGGIAHHRCVTGNADRQLDCLRAALAGDDHGLLERSNVAGDDKLARGIVDSDVHLLGGGDFFADRLDLFAGHSEDRRKAAGAQLSPFLHDATALAHDSEAVSERQRLGSDSGTELAETVAGEDRRDDARTGSAQALSQMLEVGNAGREQSGLSILGVGKLGDVGFDAESGEAELEFAVGLFEDGTSGAGDFEEPGSHAGPLRSLAGKQQGKSTRLARVFLTCLAKYVHLLAKYSTKIRIYTDAVDRAVIIYNPKARNSPTRERLKSACDFYRSEGWQIDIRPTEAAHHATLIAREEAENGTPVIFSCGGDGTLNEVINGMGGTESRLGIIRGGTGNVFAKEIRVARTPESALRILLDGDEGRFDLGKANDRYFLLMCGVGFDAEVVRKVPSTTKKLLGTTSYLLWGVAEATHYRSTPVTIRLGDDEEQDIDLYWLLLGNTRSYGGVLNITHQAIADDGLLDAYLFAGRRLQIATAARLALRRQDGAPNVSFQRVEELTITTPGIPMQADGEYFGETPVRFTVEKQALRIMMPPGQGRRLLTPPLLSLRARAQRVRDRRGIRADDVVGER